MQLAFPELYTIEQAVPKLRMSIDRVREHIRMNLLEIVVFVGRDRSKKRGFYVYIRIKREELERFKRERDTQHTSSPTAPLVVLPPPEIR
jgi:hypothetical protein